MIASVCSLSVYSSLLPFHVMWRCTSLCWCDHILRKYSLLYSYETILWLHWFASLPPSFPPHTHTCLSIPTTYTPVILHLPLSSCSTVSCSSISIFFFLHSPFPLFHLPSLLLSTSVNSLTWLKVTAGVETCCRSQKSALYLLLPEKWQKCDQHWRFYRVLLLSQWSNLGERVMTDNLSPRMEWGSWELLFPSCLTWNT